jgi:homoserine O-acetyltransferase
LGTRSPHWDANDLLAKLWTWQHADISDNPRYQGNFISALRAIRAHAILVPCTNDLYFPPADNEIEAQHLSNAKFCPFDSPWGHCVANPGNDLGFERFLDSCIRELLVQ